MLPEFELMIDDSLGFTIYVYGWLHPEDHEIIILQTQDLFVTLHCLNFQEISTAYISVLG